jgi:hypothetical protein
MAKATQAGLEDQVKIAQKAKEAADRAKLKAEEKAKRKRDRKNAETYRGVEPGGTCPHKVSARRMKTCPEYAPEDDPNDTQKEGFKSARCKVCRRIPQLG